MKRVQKEIRWDIAGKERKGETNNNKGIFSEYFNMQLNCLKTI